MKIFISFIKAIIVCIVVIAIVLVPLQFGMPIELTVLIIGVIALFLLLVFTIYMNDDWKELSEKNEQKRRKK